MNCKKCNSTNLKIVKSGPHNKLICNDCLSFQKFLNKTDTNNFLKKEKNQIKITSNKNLFDRFMYLKYHIQDVSAIMQNDMDISEDDIEDFKNNMDRIIIKIKNLKESVVKYIQDTKNKI